MIKKESFGITETKSDRSQQLVEGDCLGCKTHLNIYLNI